MMLLLCYDDSAEDPWTREMQRRDRNKLGGVPVGSPIPIGAVPLFIHRPFLDLEHSITSRRTFYGCGGGMLTFNLQVKLINWTHFCGSY